MKRRISVLVTVDAAAVIRALAMLLFVVDQLSRHL